MSARHTLRAAVGTVHRGAFDAAFPPVLTIASGDVVAVTTLSGNPDQIPPPELWLHRSARASRRARAGAARKRDRIFSPARSPSKVRCRATSLIVDIVAMELAQDWGWNRFAPGMGALPEQFPRCPLHPHRHRPHYGHAHLAVGAQAQGGALFRHHRGGAAGGDEPEPLRSFRAPSAAISTTSILAPASTVHLPVFNPGGMVSVGDGHALQGDGEVCVTAVETGLAGTLRVTLAKNTGIARPGRKRRRMSSPWRSIPI